MNKEEKEAIDDLKLAIEQDKEELPYSKESLKNKQAILNYIEKLQKENKNYKELILAIKGKLNNIQFEVEQAWRKIEKLESKYE